MKTSGSEEVFNCPYCDKHFSDMRRLSNHVRIQMLGERLSQKSRRTYICGHCSEKFTLQSDLNNHLRSHGVTHPHQCSFCDRKFKRAQDLGAHMVLNKQKQYVCLNVAHASSTQWTIRITCEHTKVASLWCLQETLLVVCLPRKKVMNLVQILPPVRRSLSCLTSQARHQSIWLMLYKSVSSVSKDTTVWITSGHTLTLTPGKTDVYVHTAVEGLRMETSPKVMLFDAKFTGMKPFCRDGLKWFVLPLKMGGNVL